MPMLPDDREPKKLSLGFATFRRRRCPSRRLRFATNGATQNRFRHGVALGAMDSHTRLHHRHLHRRRLLPFSVFPDKE